MKVKKDNTMLFNDDLEWIPIEKLGRAYIRDVLFLRRKIVFLRIQFKYIDMLIR